MYANRRVVHAFSNAHLKHHHVPSFLAQSMPTSRPTNLARLLRWPLAAIVTLIGGSGIYALAALVLGLWAVNAGYVQPQSGQVIYLRSDGIHTDIIMPVSSPHHDWRGEFAHRASAPDAPFVSFGWGDWNFYLETPTWGELKGSHAAIAMLGLGRTVMHVKFTQQPGDRPGDVSFVVEPDAYKRLVGGIRSTFVRGTNGEPRYIRSMRGGEFYEAIGSYSALNTCNGWVRSRLSAVGVRMPVWSPFAAALTHQIGQIPRAGSPR